MIELKTLDERFKIASFPTFHPLDQQIYRWEGDWHVSFIFDPPPSKADLKKMHNAKVYKQDGKLFTDFRSIQLIANSVAAQALSHVRSSTDWEHPITGYVKRFVNIPQRPYVIIDKKQITIEGGFVTGNVAIDAGSSPTQYRALIKYGEAVPYIGCALVEMINDDLFILSLRPGDKESHLMRHDMITIKERKRKKIYKQRLQQFKG